MQLPNNEYRVPFEEIEARMRPGNFSHKGFLGVGESLREVLEVDARTLEELGITAQVLANRLGDLLEITVDSGKTRVGRYMIRVQRYKGPQICPFAPEPFENPCPAGEVIRFASIDWSIKNTRNHVQLSGPGLIVYLIGAHSFFEGKEFPYRVDPRCLAKLVDFENIPDSCRR